MLKATRHANLAPNHHLTPPEHWFARFMLERQHTSSNPEVIRMQHNYGPEGIALFAAGSVWGISGGVIGIAGFALMIIAEARNGAVLTTGYSLLFLGIFLEAMLFIRLAQSARSGRKYRGSRPFEKSSSNRRP